MIQIPTHLQQIRAAYDYSQQYVAERLNVSQSAYARWENGSTQITFVSLVNIAEKVYNMDIVTFILWPKKVIITEVE